MSQTGSHSNAIETTKSKSNSGKRHETEELVGHMLGQFIIDDYVTGGSFGSFHYGHDSRNNDKVAIKLEKKGVPQPQLHLEFGFYRSLGLIRFIPKIYYFGICGNQVWHGMVMELLGPSLLAMNDKCGGTFTTATTVQLTIQLLNVFEYVHDHGLLYRDIKPENFLFGLPNSDKWCTVCLIDLGFCKRYVDEHNCHIEYKKGKPITGTARYISVNNHGGCELSRRDDMEALIYMIVFLHKGHLPWQGLNAQSMGIKERYRQMGIIKYNTTPAELCSTMPRTFIDLLTHVKQLKFDERPHYRHYMASLQDVLLLQLGTSMDEQIYDWDSSHQVKNSTNR